MSKTIDWAPRGEARREGPDEGPFFERRGSILDVDSIKRLGLPIHGIESERKIGSIIGAGYSSFEHPADQAHYRGIARTVRRYLGQELTDDPRLAIYCGWDRRPECNAAIGWEAARLSGKSGGRVGIAFGIGYPVGGQYDCLLYVPCLTESHHPVGLALTVDASLSEEGRLVVMGLSGRGGREDVLELTKSDAMTALLDRTTGQRLVRMREHPHSRPGKSEQSRLTAWRSMRWSLERIQRGQSPHSPRLANTVNRFEGACP